MTQPHHLEALVQATKNSTTLIINLINLVFFLIAIQQWAHFERWKSLHACERVRESFSIVHIKTYDHDWVEWSAMGIIW